jgi:hypothetical protein
MFWLIPVVLVLVWAGVMGHRRHAAKKDLEEIQLLMQGRIRLAFGKEAIAPGILTREKVPQAWREPPVFVVRRAAGVV